MIWSDERVSKYRESLDVLKWLLEWRVRRFAVFLSGVEGRCSLTQSWIKHISECQNKVHKGIEIKTIVLEKWTCKSMTVRSILHTKLQSLPSTSERNVVNMRTFRSDNCFDTSGDSLYFDTRSLDHIIRFYSYLYLIIYVMHFTPHILSLFTRFYITSVYKPYAEYFFLSLMMP